VTSLAGAFVWNWIRGYPWPRVDGCIWRKGDGQLLGVVRLGQSAQ
jgi:hypothetical protein